MLRDINLQTYSVKLGTSLFASDKQFRDIADMLQIPNALYVSIPNRFFTVTLIRANNANTVVQREIDSNCSMLGAITHLLGISDATITGWKVKCQ